MDICLGIPADLAAYILQSLQPHAGQWVRLLPDPRRIIDRPTAATSLCSGAMTLVATMERVYVFDDQCRQHRSWEMPSWPGRFGGPNKVVGTCNGIVCMCDHSGSIVLHNPVNDEMLTAPSLPRQYKTGTPDWHKTYRFTHNRATGRYMVVHVPLYSCKVVVFTLGEATWRDVDTHGWWRDPEDSFVTIGNTMYLAMMEFGGVLTTLISLDLDGKRAPSVIPLPSSKLVGGTWSLTEVRGSLGITFSLVSQRLDKTHVWVMEGGASNKVKHARWSRWYTVNVRHTSRHKPQWHDHQHLTWPHFAQVRNHVLTWEWLSTGGSCACLYRHKLNNDTTNEQHGRLLEISERNQGTTVAHIRTEYDTFQTFDYVETREPLSVYKRW